MILYPFAKTVTYWFSRVVFRMRYEGLEHIPKGGGYILASNHRSNFDPVFLVHKVPTNLRFMAKIELFQIPVFGFLIRRLGAFPVARGKGDTSAIDTARDIVQGGGALLMFPEGTRSKDGKPQRPRSGVALIAGQTGAGVLPCAVVFGDRLRFRTTVTIRFGELIPAGELQVDTAAPSTIRAASKRIMDAIVSLLHAGEAG